jgi:hypothetical protein
MEDINFGSKVEQVDRAVEKQIDEFLKRVEKKEIPTENVVQEIILITDRAINLMKSSRNILPTESLVSRSPSLQRLLFILYEAVREQTRAN